MGLVSHFTFKLQADSELKLNLILFLFTVENMDHSDFVPLRNMILRTHLQDLKDVTNNVHYENYRVRKLAGVGADGNPVKGGIEK